MATDKFGSQSTPGCSGGSDVDTAAPSLGAVEQRLAHVERELRIQFTRIAQLQAELDRVAAAARRSPASGGIRQPVQVSPPPHRVATLS